MVEYYLQSSEPLLCKLFEHCALAQRSSASKQCFESWRASKIKNFMISIIFMISRCLITVSTDLPRKVIPRVFQFERGFACTSLEGMSRWELKLVENLFTDSEISLKNHPKIPLKSVGCRGALCPGGVLLTEVEASPLQVRSYLPFRKPEHFVGIPTPNDHLYSASKALQTVPRVSPGQRNP